jgi:hypothetical protein
LLRSSHSQFCKPWIIQLSRMENPDSEVVFQKSTTRSDSCAFYSCRDSKAGLVGVQSRFFTKNGMEAHELTSPQVCSDTDLKKAQHSNVLSIFFGGEISNHTFGSSWSKSDEFCRHDHFPKIPEKMKISTLHYQHWSTQQLWDSTPIIWRISSFILAFEVIGVLVTRYCALFIIFYPI